MVDRYRNRLAHFRMAGQHWVVKVEEQRLKVDIRRWID